jgi:hypothetical protein
MYHEASQHYLVKTQTDILSISLIFCYNLILIVHVAVRCITSKGFCIKCIVAAYNSQAEAVAHSKGQSENHLVVIHLLLQYAQFCLLFVLGFELLFGGVFV